MFLLKLKIIPPYPSLVLGKKNSRCLVISDLHIGWEVQLSEQGIHIPSQMEFMLNKLLEIIKLTKPKTLVILGDVKHAVARIKMEEWRDIPQFFDCLRGKVPKILVVPGNHDGNLEALTPKDIEICPSSGIVMDGIGLLHGHAWPSPNLLGCEGLIMGHIHPTMVLRDSLGYGSIKQVWVKARLDTVRMDRSYLKYLRVDRRYGDDALKEVEEMFRAAKSYKVVIMPSFNDFMGGKPLNRSESVNSGYLGPIIRFMDLDESELHMLDGSFLGNLNQLKRLT